VREVVQAGVHGFLPKTATADYLQHGLQMLAAGGTSVPAEYLLSDPPQSAEATISAGRMEIEP
jgi:DNA-binding NarL/FixJ family response regulator